MKIFQGIIIGAVIGIVLLYIGEQYEMRQFSDTISEMNLVDIRDLTKVTVSNAHIKDTYTSYEINEVNELYSMLENIPLEKTRKREETPSFYKIKFADHSLMQSITYTIYDNDLIKREQDGTSVYVSSFFKLQQPIDRTLFDQWIEKE